MSQQENASVGTVLAVSIVAGLIAFVVFVLPAEYDSDPTGLGAWLGIKGMSGYSVSALTLAQEPASTDEVSFVLAPFESVEYKYELTVGQAMLYHWSATEELLFDLHSEEEGTDPEDSVTFSIGRNTSESGTYVAPYSGAHGWFWENRGTRDATVTLKTAGYYAASITYSSAGEYRQTMPRL